MEIEDTRQSESNPGSAEASQPISCRFYFDGSQHTLVGADGKTIKLRSKSLDVFILLLKNANEVVTKNEILETVWSGLSVTDDSITQCVVDIRRLLGTEHRSLLQTIPRVGYRLCHGADASGHPIICPLGIQPATYRDDSFSAEQQRPTLGAQEATAKQRSMFGGRGALAYVFAIGLLITILVLAFALWLRSHSTIESQVLLKGPTLAVLPFKSQGSASENDHFSDGITEDIIALLNRYSEIGLVSWGTISNLSTQTDRIKAVAEEFGVHYLLTGSVRHDKKRVRVAVSLADARDGRLLWSDRYDEQLQDIFLIQDKIFKQIVATLAIRLTEIETELSRSAPTTNIAAYQLSLLGRHELRRRTRDGNLAARKYFTEAIELDPGFSDAYMRLGETYLEEAMFGYAEWSDQSMVKALSLAQQAIELGGANARSLGFLALVNVRVGDYTKAQQYLDRAFVFNADDPSLHEIQGLLYLWNGMAGKAIDHLEYVLRYDPYSTLASSHLCVAYYVMGRAKDAVETIERLQETAPDAIYSHIILTAAFVESGDIESAKATAALVRRKHPFLTATDAGEMAFFSTSAIKTRFIESLNQAGIQ